MRHPGPPLRHLNVHVGAFQSVVELNGLGDIIVAGSYTCHCENVGILVDNNRHGVFAAGSVFITGARAVGGEIDSGVLRVGGKLYLSAAVNGSATGTRRARSLGGDDFRDNVDGTFTGGGNIVDGEGELCAAGEVTLDFDHSLTLFVENGFGNVDRGDQGRRVGDVESAADGSLVRHGVDCNLFLAAIEHLDIVGINRLHLFLNVEHLTECLGHGDTGV